MDASASAEAFTAHLLTTIRMQRHTGSRIVVSTQEPTVSTKLLDLCSVTFVHRFTSPSWLTTIRGHLAGASAAVGAGLTRRRREEEAENLFDQIVGLNVGESLLFAPTAVLEMQDGEAKKLGTGYVRFKTRQRLGADGGQSVLASR